MTVDNVVQCLREALQPKVMLHTQEVSSRMRGEGCVNGARLAAERLTSEFG